MNVLFVGSKDRGVACLEALLEDGQTIVGVVTTGSVDPDAFWDGSVKEAADARGLQTFTPADINAPSVVDAVQDINPDLITMSGYNQILGPDLLSIPDEGVINLHAGKLPDYRGGSPMNWAIINGEDSGTATIHYATERVDAGDVLLERQFTIEPDDTIADVRAKTLEMFPEMLVEVVQQLEAGIVETRPVDITEGTYWGSRLPQDGRISWTEQSARNVYDFVRALTHPYPGAFTFSGDQKLYVWEVSLLEEDIRHTPGRICMRRGDGRVVAARDRGVLIETVQPEGQKEQAAGDYLERGEYLT